MQFRPEQQLKVGGKFEGESKYAADYFDKGYSPKQERAPLPQNQVIPKGNFSGGSTYGNTYLETHGEKIQQFKP